VIVVQNKGRGTLSIITRKQKESAYIDTAPNMGSDNSESFANRDTPIPVVKVHGASNDGTPTAPDSRTPNADTKTSHRLSASKLKDKLESLGDNMSRESGSRMGDKMFNL
jgi:hypothetical protein